MNFDRAVAIEIQLEGGARLVRDTGGLTKYGISQRAYPDLDIANLTYANAVDIYRRDYWDRLGLDQRAPSIRLVLFDAAINQGAGKAAYYASFGSLNAILDARAQYYKNLAQNPTYAKYLNGWLNRLNSVYNYSIQDQQSSVGLLAPRDTVDVEAPIANMMEPPPSWQSSDPSSWMENIGTVGSVGGIAAEAKSLWRSKISWGAGGAGVAGAGTTVHSDPSLQSLLWRIVETPTFWLALAIVVLAGYIIYWRWKDHGRGRQ